MHLDITVSSSFWYLYWAYDVKIMKFYQQILSNLTFDPLRPYIKCQTYALVRICQGIQWWYHHCLGVHHDGHLLLNDEYSLVLDGVNPVKIYLSLLDYLLSLIDLHRSEFSRDYNGEITGDLEKFKI